MFFYIVSIMRLIVNKRGGFSAQKNLKKRLTNKLFKGIMLFVAMAV